MSREAEALSHGAATIVNAIATGMGAAIGVDLWTKATVALIEEPGTVKVKILSDSEENPVLAEKTVTHVLKHFGCEKEFGAKVKTQSNIPVARGLKSSSAAANAIALATMTALEYSLDDLSLVKLGVNAALDAKVTITGAFDDACASYFGSVVVTNNVERRIIKHIELDDLPVVLFYVPSEKKYTSSSNVDRIKSVASAVRIAYKEVLRGNIWAALTLNGLIYSSALGYDSSPAIEALTAGAYAAGLSGTGPAVTAIVSEETVDNVRDAWQMFEGEILEAGINQEKAKVIS